MKKSEKYDVQLKFRITSSIFKMMISTNLKK